jgi:hypothetical protein
MTTAETLQRIREPLFAGRTYYVRKGGNDLDDGLSVGAAFETLDYAFYSLHRVDPRGGSVEVNAGEGTWNEPTSSLSIDKPLIDVRYTFDGNLTLSGVGDATVLDATGLSYGILNHGSSRFWLRNLAIKGGAYAILNEGSQLYINGPVSITGDANTNALINAGNMGKVYITDRAVLSGLSLTGLRAAEHGDIVVVSSGTVHYNNPAFSICNAYCGHESLMTFYTGATISGAATGKRYIVNADSVVDVQGRGPNSLPGTVAGDVFKGSQFL